MYEVPCGAVIVMDLWKADGAYCPVVWSAGVLYWYKTPGLQMKARGMCIIAKFIVLWFVSYCGSVVLWTITDYNFPSFEIYIFKFICRKNCTHINVSRCAVCMWRKNYVCMCVCVCVCVYIYIYIYIELHGMYVLGSCIDTRPPGLHMNVRGMSITAKFIVLWFVFC